MKHSDYAPIVLFVYNRPEKTKMVLKSLIENRLSKESDVFIFSDGAKTDNHQGKVLEVREILKELENNNPFAALNINYSSDNKGLAKSVIEGVTQVINEYGRAIVLEDDLVLSPVFLDYMNQMLSFYENDDRIWSIAGYTPKLDSLSTYDKPVYLSYRASSWGWATWSDRWKLVDWSMADYGLFKYNPIANARLCRGGNDLPSMLRAQMKGKLDSWAIRWIYTQSKYDKLTVAPSNSLVLNDGFDGSGIHTNSDTEKKCGKIEIDHHGSDWRCKNRVEVDKKVVREFKKKNDLTLYIRIRDKIIEIQKMRHYEPVFKKNKI